MTASRSDKGAGGTPPALGTSGGELELARVGHGRFNGIDEDRVRDQTLPPQGSWVPDTAAGHAREVVLDILRNFSILKDTSDTIDPRCDLRIATTTGGANGEPGWGHCRLRGWRHL